MNQPSRHQPRGYFSAQLIGLHFLAVVALIICILGGLWQMGVYEGRQNSERNATASDQLSSAEPIDDLNWRPGEPFPGEAHHRAVTIEGEFAASTEQFWVQDPMMTANIAWLVAPFTMGDDTLLVVRGARVKPGPLPPVPQGHQKLVVVLQPSQGGGEPINDQRVTTALNIPLLINETSYTLYSGYGISVDPTGADMPLLDLPDPKVNWTVGMRNLAYAFQWWVFGAFVIFMWWRMVSDVRGSQLPGQDTVKL